MGERAMRRRIGINRTTILPRLQRLLFFEFLDLAAQDFGEFSRVTKISSALRAKVADQAIAGSPIRPFADTLIDGVKMSYTVRSCSTFVSCAKDRILSVNA